MTAYPRIPALDGVRALAVLGVLAAHTGIPGVTGGFVGVDVFFVLSGFLITSLLLDEHGRGGRSDLPSFWARRARRLLPAALVMITAVIGFRSLLPIESTTGLRNDALSAALWSSNWRWALGGTDYFAQGGTASPLQHTWSLAVEEQFYLLWPCLLVLVWAGARSEQMRGRRLFVIASLGAVASAVVTVHMSGRVPPGRVYFGTDTRAQELLIGAALAALLAPTWRWREVPRRRRRSPQTGARYPLPTLLSTAGLAVLVGAAHWSKGTPSEFRHGLMLVVSLASAAVIAGLMLDTRTLLSRLLGSLPLVAIGRISYGIYLWHWPVFEVLNGARTGLQTYELAGVRVGATLAIATSSYWLVERPVQQMRWRPARLLPAAAGAVALVLAFTAYAVPGGPLVSSPTASGGVDLPPGVTTSTSPAAQTSKIITGRQQPHGRSRGTGPITVDVFGDSIGWTLVQYYPGLPGVTLVDHTNLGCGIVRGGPYRYFGQQYDESDVCNSWPQRWAQQIANDRPDEVLLVTGRWETMDREHDGDWTHVGEPAFDAYLSSELQRAITVLGASGAKVVVATEPYNRRGEQPDGSLYPEDDPSRVDDWNAIVANTLAANPTVARLDLNKQLCPDGEFTWNVEGVQVRSDGVHLSPEGVAWLSPWLSDQLQRDRG
jgi:peptidoglycan/LPS O-acetylase OafA/YrhL